MILLVDHDDSFVHTLARYVTELGGTSGVVRARTITVKAVVEMAPSHIVLSPGPGKPEEYPVTLALIRQLGAAVPILGVCLGHQCIAVAYGAAVGRSTHPRHGIASAIAHDGRGIFRELPATFQAARYHSLAVIRETIPDALLSVSATADDGEVMAIRHRSDPVDGVQFHPESVISECGYMLLGNFLGRPVGERHRVADSLRYP